MPTSANGWRQRRLRGRLNTTIHQTALNRTQSLPRERQRRGQKQLSVPSGHTMALRGTCTSLHTASTTHHPQSLSGCLGRLNDCKKRLRSPLSEEQEEIEMPYRDTEDGMGFSGLVPSFVERMESRRRQHAEEQRRESEPPPLWSQVKDLMEKACRDSDELGQIRATLLVNFGKDAKRRMHGLVIEEKPSTLGMLVDVLTKMNELIEQ